MQNSSHLDNLRAEGALAARGEFGLDRAKAREKMQKFQLRDPHHYVLQFVQAAHLLGAEEVRFAIDADEMEMLFDCAPLEREELERLYDAAFSGRVDQKSRALRHLAIGLTAAQAMEPSVIQVDIAGEGGSLRLEVGPDGEERIEARDVPCASAGRIYLREKLRASHLVDFFRNLAGDLAEKTALREYCAMSPMRILLDGEDITTGPTVDLPLLGWTEFETDHEHGTIGILPDGEEMRVTILQNGVKVVEHRMKSTIVAGRAVIDSDRLTKNLSQSAFVEDQEWRRFIDKVLPAVQYKALLTYISSFSADDRFERRPWLQQLCDHVCSQLHNISDSDIALRNRLYGLGNLLDALPKLAKLLRSFPMWPTIDQGMCSPTVYVAFDSDLVFDEDGNPLEFVPYTREHYPKHELDVTTPAFYFPDGPPRFFQSICGEHLLDVTEEFHAAYERHENRRLWKQRPWPHAPDVTEYPDQRRFEGTRTMATLAMSDQLRSGATVWLVKRGHLLRQFNVRERLEPVFVYDMLPRRMVIAFSGDFPVNRVFDNVRPDDAFGALACELVEALPAFVEPHAEHLSLEELQGYLSHLLTGKLHRGLLEIFGVSLIKRLHWLEKIAAEQPDSVWALVEELKRANDDAVLRPDEIDARLDCLGELARAPAFEGLRGESITLAQLAGDYRRHGEILFFHAHGHLDWARTIATGPGAERPIPHAGPAGEAVLEQLFGPGLVYLVKRFKQKKSQKLLDQLEQAHGPENLSLKSGGELDAMASELEIIGVGPADEMFEAGPQAPPPNPPPLPDETPEGRLIWRLRRQLTEVRGDLHYLLDDALLHALTLELDNPALVAQANPHCVDISPEHAVTKYAIEHPRDPVALAFLASSVYTSINIHYEGVTDAHEDEFLRRLADHLAEIEGDEGDKNDSRQTGPCRERL